MYNSRQVFISELEGVNEIELTVDVRKEMNLMRMCDYENLVKFIGAVVKGTCGLVFEYVEKGSFADVIHSDVKIDDDIRFSLLHDVSLGLHYLHNKTEIAVHGMMNTSNCLVTSRWVGKVAGFGARTVREMESDATYHLHRLTLHMRKRIPLAHRLSRTLSGITK